MRSAQNWEAACPYVLRIPYCFYVFLLACLVEHVSPLQTVASIDPNSLHKDRTICENQREKIAVIVHVKNEL